MRRQRVPEVPRWRRNRFQPYPQPVVLKGRRARKYAERMAAVQPATPAHPQVMGSHLQRTTGGFRFRKHLVPFAWLAWMLAAGSAAHLTPHPLAAGLALGLISAALLAVLARKFPQVGALFTAALVPLLAAMGTQAPAPAVVVLCWLVVTVPWLHRHRWRPSAPSPVSLSDQQIWEQRIAVKTLPGTWLAEPETIPNGRRWTVMLPLGHTVPADVISKEAKIAGAWDKPRTEVFTEPYPDRRESRAVLTILKRDTLADVQEWDGSGIGGDGVASVGRFADGQRARIRFLALRDGVRHALIAGTTGSGKSELLNLVVLIALTSGIPIVPVILDPQEGQSLPAWRDKVLYAAGVTECMSMLRGLQAGMLDRSRYLAGLRWNDEGHDVRGMPFFDPHLTGLPVVLILGDEYPVLMADPKHGGEAVRISADIAKRGRKAGVALWPVAQVPSLAELGDQVVRSMLRGGNVVCLRTGDSVSAGMLGLDADPSGLPVYFSDGSPTYGLGYVVGPDQRQAPMRVDKVPAALRHKTPAVPALDDRFAAAMARAMSAGGVPLDAPERAASPVVAVSPPDDDAPEGRTASDAVLAVLTEQMDRGRIIKDAGEVAVTQWKRSKPFRVRTIGAALDALVRERRIAKVSHGVYAPVRAELRVVGSNPGTEGTEG